jgi:hypothetical protein
VDLTGADPRWRDVPMPGATAPFALTRLASAAGAFVVYGRFPAGFARDVAGGYTVAEEFIVLDGDLTIGPATYRRGDLTVIPAGYVRPGMSTVDGCTVLAWFDGPAEFHPAGELPDARSDGLTSVCVDPGSRSRGLPRGWTLGSLAAPAASGDEVTADLRTWRRLAPGDRAAPTSFVRLER